MKKVLYLFGVVVIAMFLVSGIQKIFADITNTISGDKEEQFVSVENSPLIIAGLVTEVNENSIVVYARDNNFYDVDLSNANILSGSWGYLTEPSSFSEIKITDFVTVVFDDVPYNNKILAKEIAHRRTPESIIKRQEYLAELFNVEFSTSTNNLLNTELVEEQNIETPTTTLDLDQNSATSSELNSDGNNSIIDTVADVAKDAIQGTADTLINVIDAVTGGETDTQSNTANQNTIEQPTQENSAELQSEIDSTNTEANDSVNGDEEEGGNSESPATENNADEGSVSE